MNAVKTGLTGRTVLIHSDDAAAYQNHLVAYAKEYRPAGLREQELVPRRHPMAFATNPASRMGISAQGRAENQEYCVHGSAGKGLIELGTFLKYEKQLKTRSCRNPGSSAATRGKWPNSAACKRNANNRSKPVDGFVFFK